MKPLISVIVPVYNVSKYIEQCLNSLMKQTMKNIEIIVIDDCGTDDSILKAENLAKQDTRIKIIHNKTNQGLAESRNIGLKHITSQYVAFLDSDDWVEDNFYEKLYTALTKNDADIAISDVIYWYNPEKQTHEWVSTYNFMSGNEIVSEPNDKQYNIYACACWNKLYKAEIFTKHQLKFPKGLYIEDVPITFITTMLANKIVMVKDTKLYYRMRHDSIMAVSKADRKPFDIFAIYDYTEQLLKEYKNHRDYKHYCQILDNFKIFNIYAWHSTTHQMFKEEFWQNMKKVFMNIDIENNPYLTSKTRQIYSQVLHNNRIFKTNYIKIFDLIPLFKYTKTDHIISLHLFDILPIFKYKCKEK